MTRYVPIPKVTGTALIPASHGVLCLYCGWHASDGPRVCTPSRVRKFTKMYRLFRDLYGSTPTCIVLAGEEYHKEPVVAEKGDPR